MDPVSQRCCEGFGQALVPTPHAGARLVRQRCQQPQLLRGHHIGRVRRRHLHPSGDRLGRSRIEVQRRKEPGGGHRSPIVRPGRQRGGDHCPSLPQGLRLHPDAPARLPVPVRHALRPGLQAEPRQHRPHHVVAGKDELGPHLDHGAVGQPPRMDPPANSVPGLQDDDLDPGRLKSVGRSQPGEPGTHDDHAHSTDPRSPTTRRPPARG